MIDSLVTTVSSNTLIATLVGLTAWFGSRLLQRPSLWYVVWILVVLKLFLPTVWSVSVPSLNPTSLANQPTQVDGSGGSDMNPGFLEVAATSASVRTGESAGTDQSVHRYSLSPTRSLKHTRLL
jgi:hypothetical protein